MRELPQGWVLVQLGSVGTWGSGGTPKRTNDAYFAVKGIPWLVIGDLTDGLVVRSNNFLTQLGLQNSSAKILPIGTLLVAMYGSIGKLGITGIECATNQAIAFCRPNEAIVNLRYLYYALFEAKPRLLALGQGGAQQNISQSVLKKFQIALAPKNEQTRIANQLDTLLTRIQACNDRFDAILALLKRFRQTVLTAASSGDLTCDWRESNLASAGTAAKEVELRLDARRNSHAAKSKSKFKEPLQPDLAHWRVDVPVSWSVESVSAFAECLDHIRVPVTKDKRATAERLYPYFGANGQVDMVDDFLFDDELVMVTEDETFYGRVKPIAYRFSGRCWVNNHAHVLRTGDSVRADYLCFSLMYYDVQPWLTGTTGRAKLTQGALNALPLAVPPQAEMVEIVRRVNSMFALADRIEAQIIAARAQAQRLTPLVLSKAFRGELVPQDPNDEPASELLARIALENTAAARKINRKVFKKNN